MATTKEVAKAVNGKALVPGHGNKLTDLLDRVDVKRRFEDMLGKKAPGFISSILALSNTNKTIKEISVTNPMSIVSAAAIAATLDLPINPNLGFAALVPYAGVVTFQMQYKGFIQLGIRSGQYETMNVSEIYEDEIENWNPITGEIKFTPSDTWKLRDAGKREKIVGYVAFFKLLNGFRKYLYMTVAQIDAHGKRYSKSFNKADGLWQKDPHVMRMKTPLKLLLSKYGLLSIEMQKAMTYDQGAVRETIEGEKVEYPDGTDVIDAEPTPESNQASGAGAPQGEKVSGDTLPLGDGQE